MTGTPNMPAFPAQWFTAYTRSPRCPGLIATVVCQSSPANLIPASGDQDHAISLVRNISRTSGDRIASIASPHPTSVTIAIRPSCGSGMREYNHIFLKNGSKIFAGRCRIASTGLNPLAELFFWRDGFQTFMRPAVGTTRQRVN
jgi:hypothetical protein